MGSGPHTTGYWLFGLKDKLGKQEYFDNPILGQIPEGQEQTAKKECKVSWYCSKSWRKFEGKHINYYPML